jgi:hypothetical protein
MKTTIFGPATFVSAKAATCRNAMPTPTVGGSVVQSDRREGGFIEATTP